MFVFQAEGRVKLSTRLDLVMGRDVNDDRRRALVKGKFKFLYQDDTEDIEASDKFTLSVVQNKLLGGSNLPPLLMF